MLKIGLQKYNIADLTAKIIRQFSHYVQGQEPEPKIREYFYYIDHEGMLFLDDSKMKNFTSCFKEKKFLRFFFKQLRPNNTDRYPDFPWLSLCGRERNFIRCDDLPIVYTHVLSIDSDNKEHLSYAHAGDMLTFDFHPNRLFMAPSSGRVYHPASERHGDIGLVRSKLAIEFSKNFEFAGADETKPPIRFRWNGIVYELDQEWINSVKSKLKL